MTSRNPAWRIGELAASSGLSRRTLQYWDSIGLLCPSGHTEGGHREYLAEDLLRLYQVLALRSLGLSLESIATCLDGGAEPQRIVADQLAEVERRLAELTTLRDRLAQVEQSVADRAVVSPELLLSVVRALQAPSPEALKQYLDPDQIQTLGTAARAAGPTLHYVVQVEWPQLYRRAAEWQAEGVDPDDRRVQRLVRRLDQLSAQFSGGDPEISRRIQDAYLTVPAAVPDLLSFPTDQWHTVAAYLDRARALAAGRPAQTSNPDKERPR
ncbi:MAG: MerR family transcriptional regulator [Tomitella sp.]|uniref:MerR family transcriptional regulator n=1 Tax=Intrasporangium sp. TaxID=1925024 RepID=UPI002647C394|nr:MerR family transcriptional regulator [Intrasporangium sp.]MDN5759965.1 MerR family transcriptional regulator [Tomitella sp.]MDN5797326.1 MerR family transcriptional regulator [Intrasporangium sp.]